jgi:hypothetical protein
MQTGVMIGVAYGSGFLEPHPEIEVGMHPRQARLRATYSDWYDGITPGTWHHALWVREKALANLRHGRPQWHEAPEDRVLCDAHFDFQGGAPGQPEGGIERRMTRREE